MKARSSLFLAACLILCGPARAQSPRHLFLDPAIIQQAEHAALHVNPPQQREIVIRPDRPWEQLMISFYLTVRDEEGRLRLWYVCRDQANQPNVAYAESTDGVRWTKPNLGIVEYAGSKENNLVGLTSLEGVVCQDPKAPAAERYAYVTHLITEGMVRFFSPDGWHWRRDAAPLLRFGSDTQNVTFWDDRLGRYVLYLRGWSRGEDTKLYRKVVRAELPALTAPLAIEPSVTSRRLWGKDKVAVIDDELPTVFAADEHDPANSDVYNLSAQPYPLDPRWYVGFPSMLQRERNTSDGRLEMHFAGSRDGLAWHRYDRTPYVTPGLAESESASMVFMGTGLVVRGDEIWQYGTGLRTRHGDREARQARTDGVIYRYVQRVDGFVSLDFEREGGRCVTAPVQADGARLLLNVNTGALGDLRVAVLETNGEAIEGLGAEECEVLRTNSTHAAVVWKSGEELTSLAGREVRLEFIGAAAKLFSFRFEPARKAAIAPGSTPALDWETLPPIPDAGGFAAPFAGVSGGALIVAGGANLAGDKWAEPLTKSWYDSAFVLEQPDGRWQSGFKLPRPLGYGVSVTSDDGVVCIGGSDSARHYTEVFRLEWRGGELQRHELPSLPRPCANACGALLGRTIYVAGGIETPTATTALKTFWALHLDDATPRWRELEPWPGPERMLAVAGVQAGSFFLFSGAMLTAGADGKPVREFLRDAYRYTPEQGWKRLADLPRPAVAAPSPAVPFGVSSLLVLSGDDGTKVTFLPLDKHPGFPREALAYDAATDRWSGAGEVPFSRATVPVVRWGERSIIPNGEVRPRVRTPEVWSLRVR